MGGGGGISVCVSMWLSMCICVDVCMDKCSCVFCIRRPEVNAQYLPPLLSTFFLNLFLLVCLETSTAGALPIVLGSLTTEPVLTQVLVLQVSCTGPAFDVVLAD